MSNPFDMMGGMGGMGGMLGNMQQKMAKMQEDAERAEVEGVAGRGLVTVRMNGAQEVISVKIDPKVMDDREMVEDLIRAATNDAVRRSKQVVGEMMAEMAASLGLPPGMLG